MKKIILLIIVCLLLSGCSLKKTEELSSAEKFANEYSINTNNPFEYIEYDEVVDLFDDGNGVIFFGNSDCEWCIESTKILYEVINDSEIDVVYYFNPTTISDKKYFKLIELIDEKYNGDYKEINLPSVFVVKDGNVIAYSDYSLEGADDINANKTKMKNKYIKLINMHN